MSIFCLFVSSSVSMCVCIMYFYIEPVRGVCLSLAIELESVDNDCFIRKCLS